jgi:hypothetical protein
VSLLAPGVERDFTSMEDARMNPKESTERERSQSIADLAECRYRRRLRETLGINPAGIEVVLRLRNQVVELQARVHQLEVELAIRRARQDTHLVQYREACYEALWYEVRDAEVEP